MGWIGYQDDGGETWRIEQTGCWLLVRSYVRAKVLRRRTTLKIEPHRIGPDLHTVETDFHGLKHEVDTIAAKLMTIVEGQAVQSGRRAFNQLVDMRYLALGHEKARMDLFDRAWAETRRNIDRSVRIGEIGEGAAGFLREAAGMTFTAIGTFASGGTLAVAIGGGAVLKGVSKYASGPDVQAGVAPRKDAGRVAQALLEAGCDVVVGVLHIKNPAAAAAERRALVIAGTVLEAQMEVAKSLADGKSFKVAVRDALIQAGVGALVPAATERLGGKALPLLTRIAMPAATTASQAVAQGAVKAVVDSSVGGLAGKGVSSLADAYLASAAKPTPQIAPQIASIADCCHVAANRPFASPREYVELTAMRPAFY